MTPASPPPHRTIAELDAASPDSFTAALAALYEHSPWIAERAAARRPYGTARALHDAMIDCVRGAAREEQLGLIRAHPELAGREAVAGTLTAASASEQGRLGLDRLARADFERLADINRRYRERFGFPCIVALRLHGRSDTVLAEMEARLAQSREAEIDAALEQIGEIARGRLARLLGMEGGRLTTHVLDTASGIPAGGLRYALFAATAEGWRKLLDGETNANGRTDAPLLADIDAAPGRYRLEFRAGDYFRRRGAALDDPAFLDVVPLEFGIAGAQHYHVPLLCSPWSYATYRGS